MTDDKKSNSSKEIYIYVLITLIIFAYLPIIFGNLMRLIMGYGIALDEKIPDYLLTVYSIVMSVIVCVYEFKLKNKVKKGNYLFLLIVFGVSILLLYYVFFSDFTAFYIKMHIKQNRGILLGILFVLLMISVFCWGLSANIREITAEQEREIEKYIDEYRDEKADYEKKIEKISLIIKDKKALSKKDVDRIQEIIGEGE